MPKKNKTVNVETGTARELENILGYELSSWAESFERIAAGGADCRDELNESLADLCALLRARDCVIEASESGKLDRAVFEKHAPELIADVRGDLPKMNVPEGALNYHARRTAAAAQAERTLAALA